MYVLGTNKGWLRGWIFKISLCVCKHFNIMDNIDMKMLVFINYPTFKLAQYNHHFERIVSITTAFEKANKQNCPKIIGSYKNSILKLLTP